MNDEDSQFEAALRGGLAARTDDLEAPEGLAAGAIRASRRRSARRAGMVAVPVAAAVAVVLAVVGIGGGAHGGGAHVSHAPATAQPPATARAPMADASFVIERVRDQVRQLGASDRVQEIITSTWHRQLSVRWGWTDPHTHVRYTEVQRLDRQGNYAHIYWGRQRLVDGTRVANVALRIDRIHKTWSVTRSSHGVETPTVPRIGDPAHEIARALDSGHVRLCPDEMIGGQKARCLILRYGPGTTSRLWVNARTYRPINQTIFHRDPETHRLINYVNLFLRPATPANIAEARDRPDFSGYRQVRPK